MDNGIKAIIRKDWRDFLFDHIANEHLMALSDNQLRAIKRCIVVDVIDEETFNEIEHGEVFARGVTTDPKIHEKPVRWCAVKGAIEDWAIYCHFEQHSWQYVRDVGNKVTTEEVIRRLVPCTDDVFKLYRY